jgi:hypothetical protein
MKNLFKTGKRGIAAILTLCILLGIAGTCVYAASAMPEETTSVTEGTTQELVPVLARGCTGTYIPGSWSIDESYRGSSIDYVLYTNGWTLSGNLIYNGNGVEIGRYDAGHLMDGQYTVANFHIYSDINNGYGNIHYIF